MHILIAGYGYVGEALARDLVAHDHSVVALRRSAQAAPCAGVTMVQADLLDAASIQALQASVDAVVYMPSPGARNEDAYQKAYIQGLSHVLARYPEAPVALVTSTAVYHQTAGAWVDDSAPALSDKFNAKILRQAEELVLARDNACVLRASGIYGPGRTRLLSTLVHSSLEECAPEAELQQVWTCRIHRDDLASAIRSALEQHWTGRWLVTDPNPATLEQMSTWARAQWDTAERRALIPKFAQAAAVRERANRRLHPSKLLASGFQFKYPSFKEGYSALFETGSD